ncbi:U4/U6 x U5 tri-snRNP complex subunit Prp1 [Coemansia sp. RSA 1933]|nr:U4/U6 x U5 tri-snRNP complex subunit Prp1 [Coemansia sp. RSA 1933]
MYPVTKDFLGKPAPPGYVAGLGRGATGFTTRSDIGPARETAAKTEGDKGAAAKLPKSRNADNEGEEDGSGRFANAENEEGLFSNMPYEEDDEEADKVWAQIDAKMEERHRKRQKQEEDDNAPVIEEQLRGFKRQLQGMCADDWDAIPDVAQLAEMASRAKKRRKNTANRRGERMYRVSDSTLVAGLGGMGGTDHQTIGDDSENASSQDKDGMVTNFMALGQARDDVLRVKLDQAGDSASGKTTIDPRGYLTSLNTVAVRSAAEIGDMSRARMLLRSVTKTNPKHAPGWIAAARLEEIGGKMAKARAVVAEGCDNCPQSEDVWLEAARLSESRIPDARVILSSAARNLPRSVRIWQAAADLERRAGDAKAQKRILQRALEFVPTSVVLWKDAVGLEEPEEARVLLSHAVDLVPLSTELWLALARLEPYERAQKVLNRARRAVPTSHEVWIAAARLEEQEGQAGRVPRIAAKAVASLLANGALLARAQWLEQAQLCEDDGFPVTCRALVAATADLGFDQDDATEDRVDIWTEEADRMLAGPHRNVEAARAVLAHALDAMPTNVDLWRAAADLERTHGGDPDDLLRRGVQRCPQAEVLWLMAAKDKWTRSNDVDGARVVLEEAFAANPDSEAILLAAVKLESENDQYTRALALLERGRSVVFDASSQAQGTPRIWIKSAVLLRQLGRLDQALEIARQALVEASFARAYKLWLIQAQVEVQLGRPKEARQTLSKALKSCPESVELWIAAARLEVAAFALHTRARAILERARVYVPRSPQLWLEAVCLECAANSDPVARALLARAIQECPKSGILWAQAILLEPRAQRKAKSADALKAVGSSDPALIAMVARLFWSERRLDKARSWFERATRCDPDYGDAWAWWLRFELSLSAEDSDERVLLVEQMCAKADPHHGLTWPIVAKDPANARLPSSEILHKVAQALGSARQL